MEYEEEKTELNAQSLRDKYILTEPVSIMNTPNLSSTHEDLQIPATEESEIQEDSRFKRFLKKLGKLLAILYSAFYIFSVCLGSVFKSFILWEKMEAEVTEKETQKKANT